MKITVYESQEQEKFLTFWEPVIVTVLNSVGKLTSDAYQHSIKEFLLWWYEEKESNPIIAVTAYRKYLIDTGLKPATINKKLSAVRRLFETAAVVGIGKTNWPFNFEVAVAIKDIKSVPKHGKIHGTRLDAKQLKALCLAPDPETLIGRRDRAILALLVGSGLRRSELVGLTWGQLKQHGSIWILANVIGKHNRTRSPLVPKWAHKMLMQYSERGKDNERIIVSYDRHGNPRGSITPQSIYRIVEKYAKQLDFDVKPHDLRRSNAAYLDREGANIDDLRALLGHSKRQTTEGYIGNEGNMENLEELWSGFGLE